MAISILSFNTDKKKMFPDSPHTNIFTKFSTSINIPYYYFMRIAFNI